MLIAFATWDGKDCAERTENEGMRISEMAEARELLAKHRFFQVRLPAIRLRSHTPGLGTELPALKPPSQAGCTPDSLP